METVNIKTDVLCIGGGIAGLMAAIRACEHGAKVVVAEKGATRYSGAGRAGNDHYWAYVPEVHGPSVDELLKESMLTQLGAFLSGLGQTFCRVWLERSWETVQLWHRWGIPMKQNDKWQFQGHSFPGRMMTHLKYKGENQKKVLTEQALKRGVEIIDRVMVIEMLGDTEGVSGAIGVGTREEKMFLFEAKSVFLGSGSLMRMYPGITPALMGNNARPFSITGDGRAMCYRVGAELVNMEMINRHAGVKNFCRAGQGSWMGVVRDPQGRPVGKYLSKPDPKYHDIVMEVDKQIFSRAAREGSGPLYMDCTGISDEDWKYLTNGLKNEGNVALLEHLKEEGIDLRRNPVEFSTYDIRCSGRINLNEKGEASIPGLYVAGDECTLGISGAAVFGMIGGENAAALVRKTPEPDISKFGAIVENKMRLISELQGRRNGPDWEDANVALQQTMNDYAGLVRSEVILQAGLNHLLRIRGKVHKTLRAKDRWELARCLEVINLYDLAELIFVGALERKESRGLHNRVDYPYTDPLLNGKNLIIKKVNEKPFTEWRDIPK
jgi:succinate dehydrogenase/fumarate reductase flavoprotein subunit